MVTTGMNNITLNVVPRPYIPNNMMDPSQGATYTSCIIDGCVHTMYNMATGHCYQHLRHSHNNMTAPSPPNMESTSPNNYDDDIPVEDRRERNRVAARKSRQRKYTRVQQLEDEKKELENKHENLAHQTLQLQESLLEQHPEVDATTHTKEEGARPMTQEQLHDERVHVLKIVEHGFSSGNVESILKHFHPEFVLYGPQSSVHLKGPEGYLTDYAITTHLYNLLKFEYNLIVSDTPGSCHYRCHWTFNGRIRAAGVHNHGQFQSFVESRVGQPIEFSGITNVAFKGLDIVYMHRCMDQTEFLRSLVEHDGHPQQQ